MTDITVAEVRDALDRCLAAADRAEALLARLPADGVIHRPGDCEPPLTAKRLSAALLRIHSWDLYTADAEAQDILAALREQP